MFAKLVVGLLLAMTLAFYPISEIEEYTEDFLIVQGNETGIKATFENRTELLKDSENRAGIGWNILFRIKSRISSEPKHNRFPRFTQRVKIFEYYLRGPPVLE